MNRRWCFTHNNPSPKDEQMFAPIIERVKLAMYSLEIGAGGTPHLQGWLILNSPQRLTFLKRVNNSTHWEAMRGTIESNILYCSKAPVQGPWYIPDEKTVLAAKKKAKPQLAEFVDAVIARDTASVWREPGFILHKRCIYEVAEMVSSAKRLSDMKAEFAEFHLRPWQQQCMDLLAEQNKRQVLWVYEHEGNIGKTTFARYLISEHKYLYFRSKTSMGEIGHIISRDVSGGIVFDLPRDCHDKDDNILVSYRTLEDLKDGLISTTKYAGFSGVIGSQKLLVFANYPPDRSKLSADRWVVRQIFENKLLDG
jgi:hypothetical protein